MARPKEEGISFFPHKVVFEDDMEALISMHGNDALAVIERTWMMAFAKAHKLGAAFPYDDIARRKRLAETCRISEKKLTIIVESALDLGLFDRDIFKDKKVLTSDWMRETVARINSEREKARFGVHVRSNQTWIDLVFLRSVENDLLALERD